MYTVYSMSQIPYIDIHCIPVSSGDEAREILEQKGYSVGWFYNQKRKKYLIVPKSEYEENQ